MLITCGYMVVVIIIHFIHKVLLRVNYITTPHLYNYYVYVTYILGSHLVCCFVTINSGWVVVLLLFIVDGLLFCYYL